jgi:hypothetical protein
MLRNAVKNGVADKILFFFGSGAGEFALVFKLAIFFDTRHIMEISVKPTKCFS